MNIMDTFDTIIEISAYSPGIKYEMDKKTGLLRVDRFINAPMHYPCNYGYLPETLADDGDPLDVLVITPFPIQPGSLIQLRAVGLFYMSDESGLDYKIVGVPTSKLTALYDQVHAVSDLPKLLVSQIQHFFEHYKDLEPNKWVKLDGIGSAEEAIGAIRASKENYQKNKKSLL